MKLMVIDVDYNFNKMNEPVIRIYGKIVGTEDENKDVCLHVVGFIPYIYVGDCGLNIFELKKQIEIVAKGYVREVQIVKKFLSIGYQIEKSNFLKLILFSPKIVPELRRILKEGIPEIIDNYLYEADIPFKNRFMIDMNIDGTDVIEFNSVGKELQNYGINCNKLYICKMLDIRVLKDEMVKIDY